MYVKLPILLFCRLAPTRAPDVVKAQNASSVSLVVKWSHLQAKEFQGQLIGYNITFHPVKLENGVNYVNVNYTSNTTTLTNLAFYTMYVINVSAVSSGGIGPANTVKARTGAEGTVESLIPYESKICPAISSYTQDDDSAKRCCRRKP